MTHTVVGLDSVLLCCAAVVLCRAMPCMPCIIGVTTQPQPAAIRVCTVPLAYAYTALTVSSHGFDPQVRVAPDVGRYSG